MTEKRDMHTGFLGETSAGGWKSEGKSYPFMEIIRELILKQQDRKAWTLFIWPRTGTPTACWVTQ
jgi:hypothetical protein